MTNLKHHLLIAITLTICASSTGAGNATTAPDHANQHQNAEEAPRVVWDILIEGNRLVPTDDVLRLIKTKRGDKFDREKVIQDLKSINSLGFFDEQRLMCTPELGSYGVILRFRLKENMPIYEFVCEGNKAISTLEIVTSTPFLDQLGKPANQVALSRPLASLEKMYRDKGFSQARVTEVTGQADNAVKLQIVEGPFGKGRATRVPFAPAKIVLAQSRQSSFTESDYVQSFDRRFERDRWMHEGPSVRRFEQDRWMHEDPSVCRFVEPPMFSDFKLGVWKQTANYKRSGLRVAMPSGIYGLKTKTSNELLPAMWFPGESKPSPGSKTHGAPLKRFVVDHYNRSVEFHKFKSNDVPMLSNATAALTPTQWWLVAWK